MGLNIKNEATIHLIHVFAQATGESLTTAITEAVRERLERVRSAQDGQPLHQRLLAIGQECAAHLPEPYRSADHGDLLYGEDGLPR